jgi:hypothetical protein
MTKRNNEKNTGKARSEEQTLLNSAYSYYGGIVRTNGHATTAGGVRRLFAAALLSGASIMAVGLGGRVPVCRRRAPVRRSSASAISTTPSTSTSRT